MGLIESDWFPYKKRLGINVCEQKKRPCEDTVRRRLTIYKLSRKISEETKSLYTLILDFQSPEL